MLFDKNNPCYRTILFSHRIILFFRRSQCSLTKTTLLQNHSSLANRTILFVRRSRCFLTKTTPTAEPFYPRAKHNRILSQITMLFDKNNPCCRTMLFSRRNNPILSQITMLFPLAKTTLLQNHFILAQNNHILSQITNALWQKQPCCKTILVSQTEQSYSFANHDAIPFGTNNPAAEPFYPRAKHNRILLQMIMLFDKNNLVAEPF